MTVIEVRTEQGQLIEVVEVSLSEATHRIMITDDQGHQVFIHHNAWISIIRVVGKMLMEEENKASTKKETLMGLSVLIAIILLIATLVGIFSYKVNASYQTFGGFVAAIAALLLFLMAIHVIHI